MRLLTRCQICSNGLSLLDFFWLLVTPLRVTTVSKIEEPQGVNPGVRFATRNYIRLLLI
jgi:hypothetical protein